MRQSSAFVGDLAWAALLAASLGATGCFRYVPVQTSAVRPNEEVRVRITEAAAVRLVNEFGTFTGELEGQLASQGPDSLAISIMIGREYRGTALQRVRQTLAVGRADVVDVRRRQFSRGRTALAAGGALVVFGILIETIIQRENPNTPPDDGPVSPPPFRGFIRIPIRWNP